MRFLYRVGGVSVLKKKTVFFIIGIVFVIWLAGCLAPRGEDGKEKNPTPTVSVPATETPSATPSVTTPDIKEEIPVPKADIIIYSLDSDNFEKIAIQVKVDAEKITLFDLVKKITVSLGDESFTVEVKNAFFEKTKAIVDFEPEGAPGFTSPNYESSLLDCIAQSIIENYESCTAVVFRINGEAYVSDNFNFGINDAYMIK